MTATNSDKRSITADDLYELQLASSPQISPDGRSVAYSVQRVDRANEKKYSNLWIASTGGDSPRQFTQGDQSDTGPIWSRDGENIAFLSDRQGDEQSQIFVMPARGGESRPVTDMKGEFGYMEWSPDGKQIAFDFRAKSQEEIERESDDKKKELGIVSRRFTRIWFKADGEGYIPSERWHIWILDVQSGKTSQITSDDRYDERRPVWSVDGAEIVFSSNRADDPDMAPDDIGFFAISSNGGTLREIPLPEGEKFGHAVSPDGNWISYAGKEGRGDWWRNDHLWIVPFDGSAPPRCLTDDEDVCIGNVSINDMGEGGTSAPAWSTDSKTLYYQVSQHGNTHLVALDIDSRTRTNVVSGDGVVLGFTVDSSTSRVACLFTDSRDPGQIKVTNLPDGKETQLTNLNPFLVNQVEMGEIEEVWFKGPDDNDLQGWILKPPGFDESKIYPSILEIHGGPLAQYGNLLMHEFHYLSAHGYVVYFTNPRGGLGYGEAHADAISNKWGTVDYDDVIAWNDYVQKLPYIDSKRMGVTGGSYGGYMTNWIIGHTSRFKAAVTQRSVSNLVDFYASTDGNWIWEEVFGGRKPWEDFETYWRQSPIKYFGNARTPTLVIHSEQDLRCPITQSEQVYVALKRQGVDSEFVVFPGESHGLSRSGRTDRRIIRLDAIREWFDRYLK
jgi:dipeptidyl aminopeptidase/acylaminoacyl peptidase